MNKEDEENKEDEDNLDPRIQVNIVLGLILV